MNMYATTIATVLENRYNELHSNAKEVVPMSEFLEMVDRLYDAHQRFADRSNSFNKVSIARNVVEQANTKWEFIKAIKAHPAYNPEQPWKLIITTEMHRSIDLGAVRNYADTFVKRFPMVKGIGREIADGFIDCRTHFVCNTEMDTLLSEFIRNVDTVSMDTEKIEFFCKLLDAYKPADHPGIFRKGEGCYDSPRWILTREEYDLLCKRKPHDGEKSSRYVRKLITTLKAELDERKFAQFADAINPLSYDGIVVLSVDPVDYFLASNGNSWSSCYYPNYDEGDYHGMYSGGTWSYMNDACTLVQYSISRETDNDVAMEPKVYRQMIMYDIEHNRIAFSRLYPQCCDYGESEMYQTFRKFGQRVISEVFNVPNYWRTFWYSTHSQPDEFVPSCNYSGYNDLCYFRTCVCYNVNQCPEGVDFLSASKEELADGDAMEYGGPIYCPDCGNEFGRSGEVRYICDCCDLSQGKECECCGAVFDEDDLRWCDYDDMYGCEDCTAYDDYTDTYYITDRHEEEEVHTCYGTELHPDYAVERAIRNGDWFRCEECWEVFDDSFEQHEDSDGNVYCEECFNDRFVECYECGEVIKRTDAVEHNGNYYCEDCAESITASDEE